MFYQLNLLVKTACNDLGWREIQTTKKQWCAKHLTNMVKIRLCPFQKQYLIFVSSLFTSQHLDKDAIQQFYFRKIKDPSSLNGV